MRKMQPDRNDQIYCVLRSELRRSEEGFNFEQAVAGGTNTAKL